MLNVKAVKRFSKKKKKEGGWKLLTHHEKSLT